MTRRILTPFTLILLKLVCSCSSASVTVNGHGLSILKSGNDTPSERADSEIVPVAQHDAGPAVIRKELFQAGAHQFEKTSGRNAREASSRKGRSDLPAITKKHSAGKNQTGSHDEQAVPSNPYTYIGLFVLSLLLTLVLARQSNAKHQERSTSTPHGTNVESTASSENSSSSLLEDSDARESAPVLSDRVAIMGCLFLAMVFASMLCTRFLACDVWQLQCDRGYSFRYFLREDFHKVVLDMAFLFVIGRLATPSSLRTDSLAFVAVVLISSLLFSWIQELDFMKHSLSMYQMHCSWSPMTWFAFFSIVLVVSSFVLAHLYHFFSVDRSTQVRAIVEFAAIVCIFVLPRAFESGNHMHHWYTMWLLSISCRLPYLWSRGAQAFLIGGYINGVAIYGRDPVLACEAAYDLAYSQHCPFLTQCIVNSPSGPVPTTYHPPDWRTCNPGDYA